LTAPFSPDPSPPVLLPQQIAPITPVQQQLTEQHLLPVQAALADYLTALRDELDPVLAMRYPPQLGKAYPLGRCQEITTDVLEVLQTRLPARRHPVECAVMDFVQAGGWVRPVWGALREQYFQNAVQFGALYVDVSNDTVVVTKPKVEILPLVDSGLVPVCDAAHFALIAGRYWRAQVYANLVVPSLAPALPFITLQPGDGPALQAASDYMIGLFMRDGFVQAEHWLAEAPAPPPEVAQALTRRLPPDLRLAAGQGPRQAALAACRDARAAGHAHSRAWRDARVRDYLRIVSARTSADV
jgi:hypothetical protein